MEKYEICCISYGVISLKFVPKVQIENILALVQILAWRRQATSWYLQEWWPSILTHIWVNPPQWVEVLWHSLDISFAATAQGTILYKSLNIITLNFGITNISDICQRQVSWWNGPLCIFFFFFAFVMFKIFLEFFLKYHRKLVENCQCLSVEAWHRISQCGDKMI